MSPTVPQFPIKFASYGRGETHEAANSDIGGGPKSSSGRGAVRPLIYLAVAVCLIGGIVATSGVSWQGTAQLHTVIEGIATTLAISIGALALVRYYSKKRDLYLFVGSGFVATGFLDGYHMVISSEWLMGAVPASQPELIPWSWLPSRILLAGFLFAGTRAYQANAKANRRREMTIFASTAIVALATFMFFAFAPLPQSVFPGFFITRPQEAIPGIMFLLALLSCYRQRRWQSDNFEHWLLISLTVAVVTQLLVMPLSGSLFDRDFDLGHLLKLASYVCVFIGLLIGTYKTFAEAEESAEHVATIVRTAADAIVTFDRSGSIRSFNPAAEKIFGYPESEVIGMSISKLIGEPVNNIPNGLEKAGFKKNLIAHLGHAGDQTGIRKDGSKFLISLSVNRMFHGPREMFNGIIRDVTQEREAARKLAVLLQKLTRANEDLETFAYITSHDLRAPLRGIDNLATWIESDNENRLSEESLHNMKRLRLRVGRFESLLDGLQQFTQAGRNTVQKGCLDCKELVESVVDSLSLPSNFSVELTTDVKIVQVSRTTLETVLRNLIANAINHHDKRGGRVTIEVVDQFDSVQFTVSDDGPGIEPSHHKRIFDIFQTLAPKSQGKGTGVGLSIVRRLVESDNGTVTARSPLHNGRGTAFIFSLSKSEIQKWDAA